MGGRERPDAADACAPKASQPYPRMMLPNSATATAVSGNALYVSARAADGTDRCPTL